MSAGAGHRAWGWLGRRLLSSLGGRQTAWWQLEASDRYWAAGAAAGLGLLLMAGTAAWQSQCRMLPLAEQSWRAVEDERAASQQQAGWLEDEQAAKPTQWWSALPARSAESGKAQLAERLSSQALTLASAAEVQLLRLSASQQPSLSSRPYLRTVFHAELKGRYAAVKRWAAETLAWRPGALALRSMEVRRAAGAEGAAMPVEVEVSVELHLFELAATSLQAVEPSGSP